MFWGAYCFSVALHIMQPTVYLLTDVTSTRNVQHIVYCSVESRVKQLLLAATVNTAYILWDSVAQGMMGYCTKYQLLTGYLDVG